MGRLSNEPIIQHFSHPHPLRLSSLDHQQQSLAPPTSCANCRIPARGGYGYACSPCSYVLHVQCSQMPPLIHHASHQAHPLSLLSVPAYPDGSFDCVACASPGTGFSYHCGACGIDIHTLCASMPLSVLPDAALHPHPLALAFAPPYGNTGFSCDVCGGLGSSQWLYRCAPCEFDAHLECGGRQGNGDPPTPAARQMGRSASGGRARGLGRMGSGRGGWMVRQMVQGLVSTATQRIGSRFVPGYVGGDGGPASEVNGGGTSYSSGAWNGMNQSGTGGDGYSGWNGGGRGRGGGPAAWNGYGGAGGGEGRGGGPAAWNGPNGGGPPGDWNGYGGTGRGQGAQASYGNGGYGGGSGDRNGYGVGGANGDGSGASRNGYVDGGDGHVDGGRGGEDDYHDAVYYAIAAAGRKSAIDLI